MASTPARSRSRSAALMASSMPTRLTRRLQALKLALDDLPRQARRHGPLAGQAGGCKSSKVQVAAPARAVRPATARGKFTQSMKSSPTATGSPVDAMKPDTSS